VGVFVLCLACLVYSYLKAPTRAERNQVRWILLATLLAFLPIYLANVAFSKRFQTSSDSQSAFAINLLGAIVGGCLEYAALVTGYNNLLIVTGLLYLAAFFLMPKAAARSA
jgi:hypothetical protein